MSIVKKTVSISDDLYEEVQKFIDSKNFSEVVQEALKEYLQKKKKERIVSFAGALKDWKIEDGIEFVDKIREEDVKTQKFNFSKNLIK